MSLGSVNSGAGLPRSGETMILEPFWGIEDSKGEHVLTSGAEAPSGHSERFKGAVGLARRSSAERAASAVARRAYSGDQRAS